MGVEFSLDLSALEKSSLGAIHNHDQMSAFGSTNVTSADQEDTCRQTIKLVNRLWHMLLNLGKECQTDQPDEAPPYGWRCHWRIGEIQTT